MKRLIFVTVFLFNVLNLFSQEMDFKSTPTLKHEIKLSYGIFTLPNGMRTYEEDIWKGGFTANYMYRVVKWFWIGINTNWQFESDTERYTWREYDVDGNFKDFEISDNNKFFAIAPELRFSYANIKWVTLYSGFSAGYGIYKGITEYKSSPNDIILLKDYCYWNITFFGGNFHIGKKQNLFAGFELGVGFKGTMAIHGGYRF